ncbi:MAG: hypothetical protein IKZ98_01045 [Clostridia bacterium]|nr:hypothetical protein [Clostridia bacterium]
MPTWLSILLLGNLLGGRRRSFGRSLLLGGLLGWLFHRNFDVDEMQADMHRAARKVRKAVRKAKHEFRDIGRAVREQAQIKTDGHVDAVLEKVEASQARDEERRRKTDEKIAAAHAKIEEIRALQDEREQLKTERLNNTFERMEAIRVRHQEVQVEPKTEGNEVLLNRELVADLERNARTAAMAADVPTINFPEEEKYYASKKYLFTGE